MLSPRTDIPPSRPMREEIRRAIMRDPLSPRARTLSLRRERIFQRGQLAMDDRLTAEQRHAIAAQRSETQPTRRATVAALEEILYEPLPVLDHGFIRVNEYSARYSILDKEFYIPAAEHLGIQATANRQGRGEALAGAPARRVLDLL